MQDKIFNLQSAIFDALAEIFKNDIQIYLTRHESMPQKYILLEKIKEESEGVARYSKFSAKLLIFTGIKQNFLLSSIMSKIKTELNMETIEKRISSEVISFYISESFLMLNPSGYFEGALTLICFF